MLGAVKVFVNPTHVGMDRPLANGRKRKKRKPHARGDGPVCIEHLTTSQGVNPTHVGMDRTAVNDFFHV